RGRPGSRALPRPRHGAARDVELVAGAVHGDEPARAFGVLLQCAAQLDQVVVDGARVWILVLAPRLVEQRVARDNLAGMAREHLEDRERAAGQLEALATAGRDLADEIDLDAAERERDR